MLLGAHVSIAGGIAKAPARGAQLGCSAIQVFTKNQVQWRASALNETEILAFQAKLPENHIELVCVHDSYLINLGSSDETLLQKSRAGFIDEIKRAAALKIPYLVFHPGSYKNGDETSCLQKIAQSIDYCFERVDDVNVQILIETTAGQGRNVGYRFEHLAEIIALVHSPEKVGCCLDTCHIFAAGYDIRTEKAYEKTIRTWEQLIGLDKLKIIHINDSKKPFGSRIDRHENIGLGEIGTEAFRLIMQDERLKHAAKILETPGGDEWFLKNILLLKELAGNAAD